MFFSFSLFFFRCDTYSGTVSIGRKSTDVFKRWPIFYLGNDIFDPLPPIQCWKRCWVCVEMVNFFSKHIEEQILHFPSISERTCLLSNKTKTNIDSGGGVVKYAILHVGNEFCRDHCVLVMINHKSVSHIYGTPLVVQPSVNFDFRSGAQKEYTSCRFQKMLKKYLNANIGFNTAENWPRQFDD